MSLTIKRVVNVALNELGQIAKNRDFSVIAVLTDESCEAFNDPSIRHIVISSAQDASNYFGSDSRVATAVKSIFAVSGVKSAIIAKWVKAQRKIQATPNELRGSALNVGIHALKLADAKFSINLGGTTKQISVDLSGAIDLNDVATKLTTALNGENVKATYDTDGNRFKLTATTAGTSGVKIGFLSAPDSGSDISAMLNLIDGKADIINGVDGSTQPKESITQALDKLYNATQAFYGVYSSAVISDEEIEALDLWVSTAQSPCVAGYTITRLAQLENQNSNIIKQIAKKDSGRFFATFNNTGDEFAGLELLAKAVSTNWEGSYTAQTMKFKNLKTAGSDESITINEATKCDALGINYYTDYDGVNMIAEGVAVGGKFIDEVVGLDAFNDRVQKEVFSTLKGAKKIPQTDKGQVRLIAAVKRVCELFVNNGFIAPGEWRGDDVGTITSGDYLELGYYVYSPSYDTQLQTDREARKSVPINVAIKLAGAIHSVDILVNYNR